MNHLRVMGQFEPGHVAVRRYDATDGDAGHPWAVLSIEPDGSGMTLSVHLHDRAQVAELESALAQAREYLTSEAARDAA